MIKLKDILGEDFGGSYGGNKNRRWSTPSYSRGEWVDEPNDDRGTRQSKDCPEVWDAIMDLANNDPRFETESHAISYMINEPATKNKWYIIYSDRQWKGSATVDGKTVVSYGASPEETAANFKEVTGIGESDVTESVITEEEYKVAGRPVTLNKNGTEDQTKWTVTFTATGKTSQYSDVISLIKPRPKLQEPRWQDNDGDGKWYEKGDDVK